MVANIALWDFLNKKIGQKLWKMIMFGITKLLYM